jgi:hypothetical protein
MSSGQISDKILIENLKKHIDTIGFHDKIDVPIKSWFVYLETIEEYKKDDFSLFEYVSLSKETNKGKKEEDKILEPSDLWNNVLQGSIEILKRFDLRENPNVYNTSKRKEPTNDLPNIEEIFTYYKKAVEFEKILYGSDPWYRDHFAHVLRVWLLGIYIVFELKNEIRKPAFDVYIEQNSELFTKKELFAAFSISALTHDLGYPLQKIQKLNKKISEILNSFGGINWNDINATLNITRHDSALLLLKLLSSKITFKRTSTPQRTKSEKEKVEQYLTERQNFNNLVDYQKFNEDNEYRIFLRTQYKFHQKYFDSLERFEHGFLSALLLHRKLLFFKEGEFAIEEDYPFCIEEARQFIFRREILRAIATHTCDDIYIVNLLSLESLLYFADEIQEWGRPFFSDIYGGSVKNEKPKVYLHSYKKNEVSWEIEANSGTRTKDAIYWLLSVSRKYMIRFRSAPEEGLREFSCKWHLKWKVDGKEFVGTYSFDKDQENQKLAIKNVNTNQGVDIYSHMKQLDNGKFEIDELRDKIISSKEFKSVLKND